MWILKNDKRGAFNASRIERLYVAFNDIDKTYEVRCEFPRGYDVIGRYSQKESAQRVFDEIIKNLCAVIYEVPDEF